MHFIGHRTSTIAVVCITTGPRGLSAVCLACCPRPTCRRRESLGNLMQSNILTTHYINHSSPTDTDIGHASLSLVAAYFDNMCDRSVRRVPLQPCRNDFWATVCETVRPALSDRCLSVLSVCDVGVLWPNGWMDQDETWRRPTDRPRSWPHCVRRGPSSPSPNRHSTSIFGPYLLWPMDGSRRHLVGR